MPRATPIRLGPFIGGMNTASDPTAIEDSELVSCKNLELDIDGSLVSRPPIVETANLSASWSERIVIIGRGIFSGNTYLIGSNTNGTYYFNGTSWTVIQANLKSRVALQYFGYVWIVPIPGSKATQNGGRWEPSGGFVADANMPEGESAVFHKTRLYVVPGISATTNPSRLTFTDPVASSTLSWPGTNIIDVSPGDGQNLVDVIIYNDNLMLFKQDSTYVLAFDISPSDAILRCISTSIGTSTRRCVAEYENAIYTLHEGGVYEVVNYDFTMINIKTPFELDSSVPATKTRVENVFISILGDRLLVRYFNKIYVYGFTTRTWSEWTSASDVLRNFGPLMDMPVVTPAGQIIKYYGGSCLSQDENVFYIPDGYDTTMEEATTGQSYDITCYVKTKIYDFGQPHLFKRLMWWGADVLTTRNIIGKVTPIVLQYGSTTYWSEMTGTWSSYATSYWYFYEILPGIETTAINVASQGRMFVKYPKSLRFREVQFELTLVNNGTTTQGPCRLFTLTAIVGLKQLVSKQVT